MTSTSRIVAALPLRETTQIAPFGRIRRRKSGSAASSAVESAARKTRSVSGAGSPMVTSDVRSATQGPEPAVGVDVADDRDARTGPDAELVEQRRRVDPLHRGYCRLVPDLPLLVFGPRSTDVRLRAQPPADAAAVRSRDRPLAASSGRSRAWRRSRPRDEELLACHTAALPARREALLRGGPRPVGRVGGGDRAGRRSAVPRDARGGGVRGRRLAPGDGRDPARRGRARVPPGRRPPPRDAVASAAGSASTTTSRWRSPGRARPGCASCTSTSTSTTATASRRSTRADPGVLTVSIHESGRYLFPGTGFAWRDRRGRGGRDGRQHPARAGHGRRTWLAARRGRCCPSWPRRSGRTSS